MTIQPPKAVDGIISGRWILFAASALLSVIGFNWAVPLGFDADTVMQSVMSAQNVTLFYWGQDRYINLLPFIFSWVRNIYTNFYAISLTSGIAFFLFIELICHVSSAVLTHEEKERSAFRRLMFVIFVLAAFLTLNKPGIFMFAYAAQPYSLSFLFFGWSCFLLIKNKLSLWDFAGACLFQFVAMGLNPSILIASCAFVVFRIFFDRRFRIALAPVLSVCMFLFWNALSARIDYPDRIHYMEFNPAKLWHGLNASLELFNAATGGLQRLSGLLLVALISLFVVRTPRLSVQAKCFLVLLGGFAVLWWMVFATNVWVEINLYFYRYFFPTIMIALSLISIAATRLARVLPAVFRSLVIWVAIAATLVVSSAPAFSFSAVRDYDAYDKIQTYAIEKQAQFISGDYWKIWTTVFFLTKATTNPTHQNLAPVFGAGYRGAGNRPQMDGAIVRNMRAGRESRAVCAGADTQQCIDALEGMTSFRWVKIEDGQCAEKCYLFKATEIASEISITR